jgi:hypothetical protein
MEKGLAFQSKAPDCQKIFASKPNLVHHYVQEHAEKRMGKFDILHRQLFQTVIFDGGQEVMVPKQELEDEADQRLTGDEEVMRARQNEERRTKKGDLGDIQIRSRQPQTDRRWNRNV